MNSPDERVSPRDKDRIAALATRFSEIAEDLEARAVALDNRYRRVSRLLIYMMLGMLVSVVVGGILISGQQDDLNHANAELMAQQQALATSQDQIQEGRRIALRVVCATTSALIDAGRATITSGTNGAAGVPSTFIRNLERLGYPPLRQRKAAAQAAADAYANLIATRIARDTGQSTLVKPDGTLDCNRLVQISREP